MSTEHDRKVAELSESIKALASELREKSDMPMDRITAIQAEIAAKSAALDDIEADKQAQNVEARMNELENRLKAYTLDNARTKTAAILAGVDHDTSTTKSVGVYNETNFLAALVARRTGDQDAMNFVKGVLGTSSATGTAIIPNNFVSSLVQQLSTGNIYRQLFQVIGGVSGAGVDIPYEVDAITAALLQGAYGSNKDIRDFGFGRATATLYTIAQIADIGNQLLRQSNGAAEASARNRLAKSIALREATYVTNGSGSSQPLGFFPALAAFGNVAACITTLSSEPRLAALGRGIAALEARGSSRDNLVICMSTTDYWETATEGLSSYTGGWAVDPAGGAAANPPIVSSWGVPLKSDPNWPAAKVGTALIIDRSEVQMFTGQEYRIDVSSEAGSRFDQNVTGFRAEEEFGFNAEPYVRTGRVQTVTGI